jgi:hypothetical protein
MKVVRSDVSKWLFVGVGMNVFSDAEPSRLWAIKNIKNGREGRNVVVKRA